MKNRGKAFFWVFVVFLVGVLFGGTLTFWEIQPRFTASSDSPQVQQQNNRRYDPERIMSYLAELLSLNATQKSELLLILESSRERYVTNDQKAKKHSRIIRTETRQHIRALLGPAQMEKFEKFLEERREARRQRREKEKS